MVSCGSTNGAWEILSCSRKKQDLFHPHWEVCNFSGIKPGQLPDSGYQEEELKISSLSKDHHEIPDIILFSKNYLFYLDNPFTDAIDPKNNIILFFIRFHAVWIGL